MRTLVQRSESWVAITLVAGMLSVGSLTVRADALTDSVNGLNECVQKVDAKTAVTPVAETLKLEKNLVEKALVEKNIKVSDLVIIKAIASKTSKPVDSVMDGAQADWTSVAKQQGIAADDLQQQLDDAYADLAFKMLDFSKKKTAKK